MESIQKSWENVNVELIGLPKSWETIFKEEFEKKYFQDKMKDYQYNITKNNQLVLPAKSNIFKAFELCPLNRLKVVIIGQDCYHSQINQAMGLAFSVPPGIPFPPSLNNIFKELIAEKVMDKMPTYGDLTAWAQQGVLLLNSALTVAHKSPGSHIIYWEQFTDNIIQRISQEKTGIVFMLWGGYAKGKKKYINTEKHLVLEATHPSPLGANQGGWFGCNHFIKCNEYLEKNKELPINWKI